MPARLFSSASGPIPETRAFRRLQIICSRMVTAIFAGEYRSAFRGRGIEFDEVREYEAGDDVRCIDWNVTARQGRPFIKRFVEERELTVTIFLDRSASMDFGTVRSTKLYTAIEAFGLIAFAALRSHDKIALLTYGDGDMSYLKPGKGKRHTLLLIRTAMAPINRSSQSNNLAEALDYFQRVNHGRSLVCIFSDFIEPIPARSLAATAAGNDTVAVVVSDPAEHQLPTAGLLRLADAESGKIRLIDSDNLKVRDSYIRQTARMHLERKNSIIATGTALLELGTQTPPLYTLMRFFNSRKRGR
jgi:uncharacterized protein (DUF58 family)